MPRVGGFGAIKKIREGSPATKILVFTTHNYGRLATTVKASGCSGHVNEGKASEDLVRAIRAVLAGAKFFRNAESAQEPEKAVATKT